MCRSTPRRDGLKLSGRFVEHQRTLMSWPCNENLFGPLMTAARQEWAEVARAISRFEPLTMLARPEHASEAAAMCGKDVEVLSMRLDDCWIRDNGPIFVSDDRGRVAPVRFQFDGWGGEFPDWAEDAAVPLRLAEAWGASLYEAPFVLEGGAFNTDGEGTVLTTEQCLLHSRNLGMSRRDYERQLSEWMGIEKVIWLPFGLVEDSGRLSTGGHVDDVAQFLGPELVLAQSCRPGNPNYSRLQENLEVLRAATDAQGRALEVVEIELLPYVTDVGRGLMHVLGPGAVRSMPAPYVNLVFVNGGVLVPQVGANGEEDVYALLARLLPGREVVPARVELQAFGGGGLGCITQQVPAGDVLPAS